MQYEFRATSSKGFRRFFAIHGTNYHIENKEQSHARVFPLPPPKTDVNSGYLQRVLKHTPVSPPA